MAIHKQVSKDEDKIFTCGQDNADVDALLPTIKGRLRILYKTQTYEHRHNSNRNWPQKLRTHCMPV